MKKRGISIILALIMVLALLPVGAAKADTRHLTVGGTEIDLTQNGSYFDGKVVFEIIDGKNVLTLNDYKLENYNSGSGISAHMIDLTIVGSAEIGVTDATSSAISTNGNLTLNGDFTLRAQCVTGAALSADANLTVEGGALDVENTYERQGAITVNGTMTVNGGTVHAKANGAAAIDAYGGIILNNGEAYLLGDADASEVFIGKKYPLEVGGEWVNDLNKGDIFGDGTAKFEIIDGKNVLTLNDWTLENYDGDTVINASEIDLIITGSAEIGVTKVTASAIFVINGSLTLNGDFTLRANKSTGGTLSVDGNLTIEGGALDVENTYEGQEAITVNGTMTVNGGTVHAKANGAAAIYTYGGIILNNYEAYLSGNASSSEVIIGKKYPLWVGDVQVTSANQGDIFGDGTAKFEVTEEGKNVLTLTNANIGTFHQYGTYENNYANICCDETAYALTINLVGDNTLSNGNRGVIIGNAFRSDGALTLTGEGTLTISDVSYGIEANGTLAIDGTTVITDSIEYCAIWGYQVDITGSTVTASGGTFGLCVGAGNLTVTDSTVTATGVEAEGLFLYVSASFGGSSVVIAESTCSGGAIRVHGEITLNDGIKMVTPEGGVYVNTSYGGKKLCLSDGETVATGAVFSKEFTITFVNEDGTELQSGMVAVGETPAYTGEEPTKHATAKYTYTFAGWTPEIVPVTGDATYTATYSSTVNEYTITFVNEDGTELQSGKVAYDETPAYTGATPQKPATSKYTYTFAGWTPEIVPVTGDATYTATYSSTVNEYTITFVNEDGTELQSGKVAYDETPVYIGEDPTKPATAQYTYIFSRWTPEVVPVTGDATYTATYAASLNYYTVSFVNEDGTLLQEELVGYGEMPEYKGATPEKAHTAHNEYAFAGWTPEIVPVAGDATYTATYTEDLLHPTFVGSGLLAYDNYIEEDGELLYRFDVTAKDVLDGALPINSAQIFVTYDHDTLAFRKGEGAVDWELYDVGDVLSAVWASDKDVEIKEGDVILTLWFAKVGEPPKSGIVDIAFTTGSLGDGSALSFVNEGAVLELEARTEDGFIQFDALLYGDANCDGKVTSADASLILRALVGLSELTPRGALQADVDLDGEVTAEDAALILRYMVGLVEELPLALD